MKRLPKPCPECGRIWLTRTFAQSVRWDRLGRKMSMRQYAEATGLSAATISRVEMGKLPDLKTAAVICRETGDSLQHLVVCVLGKSFAEARRG